MKKILCSFLLIGAICAFGTQGRAQNAPAKFACISFNELLSAMPEFKKADTTLAQYRTTLQQNFEAMKNEYTEQANLLTSKDTSKFTASQLGIKRQSLNQLLAKIQGFESEAGQLFNEKRNALLQPIQKKAEDAIQQVSKDNGYAFVFEKDNLHAYPPSTDILPLVKKKLGIV
jgi:outer membrane protein